MGGLGFGVSVVVVVASEAVVVDVVVVVDMSSEGTSKSLFVFGAIVLLSKKLK